MYLSKLEVIGFKSFAQKVNLAFDSGISAIVGPNGCGKTNIVDAIRWVLGEQRYSALRSEKMEDVIFNGTKVRKPLGMAEVSLIIENTKGILPSEYSQVTIGRRVYRSGESEYLLNKATCRLKDILDLFMDTGMGADAYSVIELKMVETILSDRTEERRRLFEEAAGVTKYKHRRKAAYRKLESVQADLVRVNDIVSEVQKSVGTLERQARKAEQFNEVKGTLRSLEIDLMEREYAQLHARTKPLEERLAALGATKDKIDTDLMSEEARLESLRASLGAVDQQLAEAQRAVNEHLGKVHRVEQKNLVAAERAKALHENIVRYENEKAELAVEMQQLETLKVTLEQRILELGVQEGELIKELELKKGGLSDLETRRDAKKLELHGLNDRTIQLVHEIADRHTALDRKKGRVENLHGRAGHASEEITGYEQEIIRLDSEIANLTAEDKALRRTFASAEVEYQQAEEKKERLKADVEQIRRKEMDLRSEIASRQARVDFLKGLLESGEGVAEGVRYLVTSNRWSASRRITVADAVFAEEQYRTAIESALGDAAGFLIVDTSREAEEAVAILKAEGKGKATFVCLERIPRITGRVRLPSLPGVIGWASEVAQYEEEYAPLFRLLFDRVLIVDRPETAELISQRFPGIRCVTSLGEHSTGTGVLRGGSQRQDEGGTIGRQNQIASLEKEIASLFLEAEAFGRNANALLAEHEAIDIKAFAEAVKRVEKEMSSVEVRLAQVQFEKTRAADIITRNKEDIERVTGEANILTSEITDATPALMAFESEKVEVERRVGSATTEFDVLESEWSIRSAEVHDLGIRLVTSRGELGNAQADLHRADETIADIVTTIQRRNEDIRRTGQDILETNTVVEENSVLLRELQTELSRVEAEKSVVDGNATGIRNEIHQIELRIKDDRRQHDDSLKAAHDLELKIAELKARSEHIRARAFEEFEFSLELKGYPEDEFVDFAALRDEIQGLRDKIKSLGNINFAAFEEYTSEKERSEFLTAQRKDLLEAEKTLLDTIEEINTTAQRKFMETFTKIRENFIETFKSLFDPGDECDLKLEEGVDPLEAGIEIVAKPRGKRPTSIDLLSGGEKTLTAIALLFAIYLVKPSPFCILDEVDAPLDDANIDRFTRIIRKFSNNTQFIVVTHNKRTMEAANALYGVTMEEEGVSKIVTVRFNQGAEVRTASLVTG